MTDAYRTLLGAAGYHELALGFRLGIFGEWEDWDLPLADLSVEELRERAGIFWNLIRLPQEDGMGLFELQERLTLTDRELYLVFLSALWWISVDFRLLLERLQTEGAGIGTGLVLALMEASHGQEGETDAVDIERMQRFALLDFSGAALARQGWPSLDEVMADHFTVGVTAPLWWSMGTEWFRCKGEIEEIVGSKRRELAVRLAGYLKTGTGLLFLDGESGSGRRFLVRQAAGMLGKNLLFVRLTQKLLTQEDAAAIVVREALLGRGWPVAVCTQEAEYGRQRSFLQELKYRCQREGLPLLVIGGGEENSENGRSRELFAQLSDLGQEFLARIPGPDRGERLRLWQIMSSGIRLSGAVSLEELADRYELLPGQIRSVLVLAQEQAKFEQRSELDQTLLFSCCHRCLKQNFGKKAVMVPVRFSWEDLLLEKKQKDKLMRAENQIRYGYQVFEKWGLKEKQPYGHGVSLVFSGPPGTGKTMAAQVLAGRIGMELYRVELPAVVSKYIGETEKNLNEIFENARKAQVVLFFDEADVLFGKRTDVRDSNDKYSNMEAAFLLQKMESYSGVTILATNFLRNMDEAFKRRMRYLVEFPFPDRHWRLEIWKRAFPSKLPLKPDIDLEFMAAAFELSGAGIRNVVLEAAFRSAAENEEMGMAQLIRAAKEELEKNGKTMALEEFGPYIMYLDAEEHYV